MIISDFKIRAYLKDQIYLITLFSGTYKSTIDYNN